MADSPRKILVTGALPYANGRIHLGHLLEYIQTDIWARFQRLRGHTCYYVCADDAHGTPIMLKAEEEGITPQQLIDRVYQEHTADFAGFLLSFDNYYTTHSPENRHYCELIYRNLARKGHINRRTITQLYDPDKQMFLPDRYVKGICPRCRADDQYGDNCEACGATYAPNELINPRSAVSGATPIERESEQLFFQLGDFEEFLTQWLDNGQLQPEIVNKQKELLIEGLLEWDISRNAPYWGFEIPDEKDKYFYVWMDAPIGYLASFHNLCERDGLDFAACMNPDSDWELYHFIGKDIARFHTMFWPAQLHGAGFRIPTGVWAHGFLTVNGQKMSKSRGTFITANTYLNHLNPEYLRYYFAGKLDHGIDDLDLNVDDFRTRINADLVGKFVNIASRCAGFINKTFGGKLAAELPDPAMFEQFARAGDDIAEYYETRRYSRAIRQIMALADRANQYIDAAKPWVLVKDDQTRPQVQGICTQGLNLFRQLMVYLKPVLPQTAASAEQFMGIAPLTWADAATPWLDCRIDRFKPLLVRITDKQIDSMMAESLAAAEQEQARLATHAPIAATIGMDDFLKVDLRVAKIIEAAKVPDSERLLQLKVDLGDQFRTVFAGIQSAYQPEQLIGRLVVVVANLAPRKMRFGVSEGMVLCAGDTDQIYLLHPDSGARPGMRVT